MNINLAKVLKLWQAYALAIFKRHKILKFKDLLINNLIKKNYENVKNSHDFFNHIIYCGK